MKCNPEQLTVHLKKSLLPLYLIGGDVPLLVQEIMQDIKHAAQKAGYSVHSTLDAQGNFDWQVFYTSAYSLSLFSSKTLLPLNLGEKAPKQENITRYLLPYLMNPPGDKILLMTLNKIDSSLQNTEWIKTIEQKGVIVHVWPITREQLPRWLKQRMQRWGMSVGASDLECMSDCVEGNITAAAQAVEKLYFMYGSRFIRSDEVAESLLDNTKFEVFQWIHYALEGNHRKVIQSYYQLKRDNKEPSLLLWMMAKELRRLFLILNGLESGKSEASVFTEQKIGKKYFLFYKRCIKKIKKENVKKLLAKIHWLDLIIKGAVQGDIWDELLTLSLQLTGEGS